MDTQANHLKQVHSAERSLSLVSMFKTELRQTSQDHLHVEGELLQQLPPPGLSHANSSSCAHTEYLPISRFGEAGGQTGMACRGSVLRHLPSSTTPRPTPPPPTVLALPDRNPFQAFAFLCPCEGGWGGRQKDERREKWFQTERAKRG